jgi:hypothetical protein
VLTLRLQVWAIAQIDAAQHRQKSTPKKQLYPARSTVY